MRIALDGVVQGYGAKEVIHGFNGLFETGSSVSLLGPNGSGKSTLIRSISGLSRVRAGSVSIDGTDINDMTLEERSKIIAYVPQNYAFMPYNTVMDVVLAGRLPHMGWEPSDEDLTIVQDSLRIMNVLDYADRDVNELSGGQRQRVFIARALAQSPKFFIFDEPTSSLDLRYQIETMKIMRGIAHK